MLYILVKFHFQFKKRLQYAPGCAAHKVYYENYDRCIISLELKYISINLKLNFKFKKINIFIIL